MKVIWQWLGIVAFAALTVVVWLACLALRRPPLGPLPPVEVETGPWSARVLALETLSLWESSTWFRLSAPWVLDRQMVGRARRMIMRSVAGNRARWRTRGAA